MPCEYIDEPYNYRLKVDSMGYSKYFSQTVYTYLHCARRGELRQLAVVTKMPKNLCYVSSKSFKVI